ncbi:phosphatase 2C-like domain-containing protein [Chytriomyces sp. MP71]|nr:phosphatase 2C-like domain-containing protein [Chytriomyces sp. MP71]
MLSTLARRSATITNRRPLRPVGIRMSLPRSSYSTSTSSQKPPSRSQAILEKVSSKGNTSPSASVLAVGFTVLATGLAAQQYYAKSLSTQNVADQVLVIAGDGDDQKGFNDNCLNADASIVLLSNQPSLVARIDSAHVACNSPSEDRAAQAALGPNSHVFVVLDGHVGQECAEIVATHFPAYIQHELEIRGWTPNTAANLVPGKAPFSSFGSDSVPLPDESFKNIVTDALEAAFLRMDNDILQGAFIGVAPPKSSKDDASDDTIASFNTGLNTATSGACALVAFVDHDHLFVSCAGDSRAILGTMNPLDGSFEAIDLSVDNRPNNPDERARILAEHPNEAEDQLIGLHESDPETIRLVRYIAISRALGDARLKWPIHTINILPDAAIRKRIPNILTPPYVTAKPLTQYRRIAPGSDMFLIMGTDGLTDMLKSSEAVSVVHGFMRTRGAVPTVTNKEWDREPLAHHNGWVLDRDENAAGCLIRNALGGTDDKVAGLLGHPSPRDVRDDTTVKVVFFRNGGDDEKLMHGVSGVSESELPPIDSRLALPKTHFLPKWIQWLEGRCE